MREVFPQLFVGAEECCALSDSERVVVHACKSPCHQKVLGYRGSLSSNHKHYLSYEKESDLYLNIIDPERPLFKIELFQAFMEFAVKQWQASRELIIHCNQGRSRAPSLAMLFLATHIQEINAKSFQQASSEFETLYPPYEPGNGIRLFMEGHWEQLTALPN